MSMIKDIDLLKKEINENINSVKESISLLEKIFEYQAKEILDRDYKWSV
ncbi:MAG TPA: hypothetical protein PKW55_08275 [Spirochaetota bacterium]|nr:hypothetical protein [Spirochaetota bacterium]HOM39071.1 hypothetical protein [Spirochaetota bacterium]HPQ49977.1 hypothetical protein [Spirochaetota bacterium]